MREWYQTLSNLGGFIFFVLLSIWISIILFAAITSSIRKVRKNNKSTPL